METIKEVLIPLLALYGAGLSTYVCYKNIQSNRPKVFTTHGWSYEVDQNRRLNWFPTTLTLHAVNRGQQEVVVVSLGLELSNSNIILPTYFDPNDADAPEKNEHDAEDKRLQYGDKIEVVFGYENLLNGLRGQKANLPMRVRAVCEDSLENFYFSTYFEIGKEICRKTAR